MNVKSWGFRSGAPYMKSIKQLFPNRTQMRISFHNVLQYRLHAFPQEVPGKFGAWSLPLPLATERHTTKAVVPC